MLLLFGDIKIWLVFLDLFDPKFSNFKIVFSLLASYWGGFYEVENYWLIWNCETISSWSDILLLFTPILFSKLIGEITKSLKDC